MPAIHPAKSCHATGLPNPCADFLVVGKVQDLIEQVMGVPLAHGIRGPGFVSPSKRREHLHFTGGDSVRLYMLRLANSFTSHSCTCASLVAATYHFLTSGGEMLSMPCAKSFPLGENVATLVAAIFPSHHCTMAFANSSLLDITGAPLVAPAFNPHPVPDANSPPSRNVAATLEAAFFCHCTMSSEKSLINNTVGAPLMAAPSHLRAMPDTNSSVMDLASTSILTTAFGPRAMACANSSLYGITGAPFVAAFPHLSTMCHTNSSLNFPFAASKLAAFFSNPIFFPLFLVFPLPFIPQQRLIIIILSLVDKIGGSFTFQPFRAAQSLSESPNVVVA